MFKCKAYWLSIQLLHFSFRSFLPSLIVFDPELSVCVDRLVSLWFGMCQTDWILVSQPARFLARFNHGHIFTKLWCFQMSVSLIPDRNKMLEQHNIELGEQREVEIIKFLMKLFLQRLHNNDTGAHTLLCSCTSWAFRLGFRGFPAQCEYLQLRRHSP
jgi:hypothetical protein